MAPRKNPAVTKPKAPTRAAAGEQRAARQSAQPSSGGDTNRLLREAAWSRMFGRVESKNPFTR
jgi:hypothetical protein